MGKYVFNLDCNYKTQDGRLTAINEVGARL